MGDKARPRWIPVDSRIGERWAGVTAMAWGAWLLLPWSSFQVSAFRLLGEIVPENAAGAFMVALGLTVVLTASNGARRRMVANAVLTFAWWFIAATAFISTPASTAFVLLAMMGSKQATFVVNGYLDCKAEQWLTRENTSP
jgi:hypothetical protein